MQLSHMLTVKDKWKAVRPMEMKKELWMGVTLPRAVSQRERVSVGGLLLDPVTLKETIEKVEGFIKERTPHYIATVNLQFITLSARYPSIRRVINNADLVVADGMPVVWLSQIHGTPLPERITGHDLLHHSADLAAKKGYSLFLLGATSEIADKAAKRLCRLYPGLKIAGMHQGSFTLDGNEIVQGNRETAVEVIKRCRPDILFVALGCPKQEFWMHNHLREINVPVSIGIGGVLDVLAGRHKRAPIWMQRTGLEWFYRLEQEPSRLWKRYLLGDVPTFMKLSGEMLSKRLLWNSSATRP